MANRNMPNRAFSSTRDRKTVDCAVTFGTSGAPTLAANGFVKSVTRNAQGAFTFVFGGTAGLDPYYSLKQVVAHFDTSGVGANTMAAAPFLVILDNQIADATKAYVKVGMFDGDTPALTDPASGEIGYFTFTFGDSSAP